MKKLKTLHLQFQPEKYNLLLDPSMAKAELRILGNKVGRPNHRITLHQKKLKIESARLIRKDKNADISYTVDRLNHLNSFEEVRIHTKETIYPGRYEIVIRYGFPELIMTANSPNREILPCIDESEAWAVAKMISTR
jgi:hypothetical protein